MRKVLYIFGLLTDADVAWMAQTGIQRRLGDGDVIIRQGESTDSLIILLEGELLVTTRRLGQIARLGVGEVVGEISLVDSAPTSATITASGNGLALFLDKTKLMQKLDSDDGFGSRFYHALAVFLADRLREARGSFPQPFDRPRMIFMSSVREIEPHDVDAGADHPLEGGGV